MEEISGSEEMQIASKHGDQRKEYPICPDVSTQIWTIQRIFQLDSRYKPAGMTGEEYGSNKSGVCLSPLIRIPNKKRPSACRGVFLLLIPDFILVLVRVHLRSSADTYDFSSASFTFCVLPPVIFSITLAISNFAPPIFIAQIPFNRQAQRLFKIVLRLPPQRHNF